MTVQVSFNNQIYKSVNFNGLKFTSEHQRKDFIGDYGIDNLVKCEDTFSKIKGGDVRFDYRGGDYESTMTQQINGKTIKATGKSLVEILKSFSSKYNSELAKMGLVKGGSRNDRKLF